METKHTPEPWHQSGVITINKRLIDIGADDNSNVAHVLTGDNVASDATAKANARRIVACVNELAGKPEGYVAAVESELHELKLAHAGVLAQRDELVKAAQHAEQLIQGWRESGIAPTLAQWVEAQDLLLNALPEIERAEVPA